MGTLWDSSITVAFGHSPSSITLQCCLFLPCAPVALISPFSLCWHKDSCRSRVRECIQLEASVLPKVGALGCPCTGLAGSVLWCQHPPCSQLQFVPAGNIIHVKHVIFVFAASGVNRCPPQGWIPERWQGFITCCDLWWRWSRTEPASKEPQHQDCPGMTFMWPRRTKP